LTREARFDHEDIRAQISRERLLPPSVTPPPCPGASA
jgi:hypothetical protein